SCSHAEGLSLYHAAKSGALYGNSGGNRNTRQVCAGGDHGRQAQAANRTSLSLVAGPTGASGLRRAKDDGQVSVASGLIHSPQRTPIRLRWASLRAGSGTRRNLQHEDALPILVCFSPHVWRPFCMRNTLFVCLINFFLVVTTQAQNQTTQQFD